MHSKLEPTNTKNIMPGLCDQHLDRARWFSLTSLTENSAPSKKVKVKLSLCKSVINIPGYLLTTRTACHPLSRWSVSSRPLLAGQHIPGLPVHEGPSRGLSDCAFVLLLQTQVQKASPNQRLSGKAAWHHAEVLHVTFQVPLFSLPRTTTPWLT